MCTLSVSRGLTNVNAKRRESCGQLKAHSCFPRPDGCREVELTRRGNALKQAGAELKLLSDKSGRIQAMNHDKKGSSFGVDLEVAGRARGTSCAGLPRGCEPGQARDQQGRRRLRREFMRPTSPSRRSVMLRGLWWKRTPFAGAPSRRGRVSRRTSGNAGGAWVDKQVALDRSPHQPEAGEDLPAFCAQLVTSFRPRSRNGGGQDGRAELSGE